jgi:Ger(x)C family germination protein
MVGWLGEIDTVNTKIISNLALGGVLVIDNPKYPGKLLTLEFDKIKTSIRPVIKSGEITMKIKIKAVSNIAEIMNRNFVNSFDEKFVKEIEKSAEKTMKEQIEDTVRYVQERYGVDIFDFDLAMMRYAPNTWDRVKDDWEEIFPQVKVNINVDMKVEQTGLVK